MAKYPVHFGEGDVELFPFCEDMFVPGKSSVEVESEVFDVFFLRKLDIVYVDQ
jgi:hypothetical protein